METVFYRKCPQCGKELSYINEKSIKNSIRHKLLCNSCGGLNKARKIGGRGSEIAILLDDSPESFYWMGFILADGSFNNNRFKITLAIKDKDHLIKLAEYLKYFRSVSETSTTASIDSKNIDIIPLICDKFDIKPQKTFNPPATIKHFAIDLQYCLLAGFIDGDGHIRKQYNRNDFLLVIKNHSSWENILREFNELIDGTTNFTKINNSGYARLIISNSEVLKNLKKRILSYNIPIMNRKWDIIDLNFVTRNIRAEELKSNVLKDLKDGLSVSESSVKNNSNYENVYRIKRKYFDI